MSKIVSIADKSNIDSANAAKEMLQEIAGYYDDGTVVGGKVIVMTIDESDPDVFGTNYGISGMTPLEALGFIEFIKSQIIEDKMA